MSLLGAYLIPLGDKGTSTLTYVTISLLIVWLMWPKCRQWILAQKIPGPSGIPVAGSGLQLHGNRVQTFKVINSWFKTYGHVFKTWSILNLTVFLSDPHDIKAILTNKNLTNRPEYFTEAVVVLVGGGLLTAKHSKWKSHRKIINPIFHTKILESFVEIFAQNTISMTEKLGKEADGRSVNFCPYISLLTIETICRTVVGFEGAYLPGGDEGMKRFHAAVERSEEIVYARVIYPWLQVPWLQRLFSLGREMIRLREVIQSFMKEICATDCADRNKFQQKLQDVKLQGVKASGREGNETEALEDDVGPGQKCDTLLKMLIKSSENDDKILSPKRMQDEILGIMLAGLETTAISMSFLLILLGIHEDVQTEISGELDEIFEGDQRPVTIQDLPRLKTLERAIKESLRLFPTAPLIPREIPEDFKLPSGFIVPAGSNVLIYPYQTHRIEQYYPEPDKFIPDRWLPENQANLHPFAYIAFGAGVRNCIGHRYAMTQMKVVVSTLLRTFKVTTCYTMRDLEQLAVGLTLRLEGEYTVQFHKR